MEVRKQQRGAVTLGHRPQYRRSVLAFVNQREVLLDERPHCCIATFAVRPRRRRRRSHAAAQAYLRQHHARHIPTTSATSPRHATRAAALGPP